MLGFEGFLCVVWFLIFCVGLGLGRQGPFQVADAGNLGGGIRSCFGGFGGRSGSHSATD